MKRQFRRTIAVTYRKPAALRIYLFTTKRLHLPHEDDEERRSLHRVVGGPWR